MTSDIVDRLRAWQSPACSLIEDAADEITKLRQQRDELVGAVERCYKMLLSEPDTQGALFKAENILRELLADAALAKIEGSK